MRMRCTKLIINLADLRHNFFEIKKTVGEKIKVCASVKADAYGHGAVNCAKELESCGIDFLAVATVDEGVELRKNGIKVPILVLSLCCPEEVRVAVKNNLTPLVFDEEYIDLFEQAAALENAEEFSVHLAVDSGMGRIGCMPERSGILALYISEKPHLVLGGICTHFACADSLEQTDVDYTLQQLEKFNLACMSVEKAGINPGIKHCSSSAAALNLPSANFDMIRAGLILYGYYPSQITENYLASTGRKVELKKVMTFQTEVVAVRPFKKGQSVSYGHTWTASEDTLIAVLPVGYADGLRRSFSPGIKVCINGKLYPVCGRICMDQCMVNIGKDNADVKRWDTAVIFGTCPQGTAMTADDLAALDSTISYEIMTGISKRVPRIYL